MSPLTHRISRSTWYVLIVVYVSMFALTAASIYISQHAADQSNRRWCGVLRVYHESARTNPAPATQYGRDILAQLEQLYSEFHCDRVPMPDHADGGRDVQ